MRELTSSNTHGFNFLDYSQALRLARLEDSTKRLSTLTSDLWEIKPKCNLYPIAET